MAILYPLVLAGAALILVKSRQRDLGARGWPWFVAWAFAGALFLFSFLTGFSIGVFLFPAAAFAVFWLAAHAPNGREVSGFLVGIAAVLLALLLV